MYAHNIKSYGDYSKLILRFEERDSNIEYKYLLNESLSMLFITDSYDFKCRLYNLIYRKVI